MDGYPHLFLVDFVGQCISGAIDDVRVLVPLCGKSAADMKWLYDEGYRVFGVDSSEKALQGFFKEYDMQYLYTPAISDDGFGVFKSADERIKLFCGDFFRLSKGVSGSFFDVVWDRSAFTTIDIGDREKYINVMRNLLLPTGRILLSAFNYDDNNSTTNWRGPNLAINRKDVQKYFDKDFHVNALRCYDSLKNGQQETGYMLSRKT